MRKFLRKRYNTQKICYLSCVELRHDSITSAATLPISMLLSCVIISILWQLVYASDLISHSGQDFLVGDKSVKSDNITICEAGTGPLNTTSGICPLCPTGTYSVGISSGPCIQCVNAPVNSYYIDSGCTTPNCPYQCDPGFITFMCLDEFDYWFPYFGGLWNTVIVGILFVILSIVPRYVMKFCEKSGWWHKPSNNSDTRIESQPRDEVSSSMHS